MSHNSLTAFIRRVRSQGTCLRRIKLKDKTLGERCFELYSLQKDRFILQTSATFEKDQETSSHRRPVILIRRKDLLAGNPHGWLFALGVGHFGSILTPLFSKAFGEDFCKVPPQRRTEILAHKVVLASLTPRTLDLLQRDTDFQLLKEADEWLQQHAIELNQIRFIERTADVLDYAERMGQLWRVRSQVYTLEEMRESLHRAYLHFETEAHYYVSIRGVRWLTYQEFCRLIETFKVAPEKIRDTLREWVALTAGETQSAMRRIKFSGRYAIEFFGLSHEHAEQFIIPVLEAIAAASISLQRQMRPEDVIETLEGLAILFRKFLTAPFFADIESEAAIRELYARISDDATATTKKIDFDARRIALPGATFNHGVATYHVPWIDKQSKTVIDYLTQRLSQNEMVEHINIYDVRSAKVLASGSGKSREIVLKTNRMPIPISYIQKRLGSVRAGYANYLLTRANVFRALGVDYPFFQLINITSHDQHREETPYFIRSRCPGDPLDAIAPELFKVDPKNPESYEEPNVILALAELYGNAAAQNLTVKKFLTSPISSCRFGQGKEIFEFAYDARFHRPMPTRVRICSIRGTMGWPNLTRNSTNLKEVHKFYLHAYALAMGNFWRQHAESCTLNECASAFFNGFERKIEAILWAYHSDKENFDTFDPGLRQIYNFRERFDFALWALQRAGKDLSALREHFMDHVRAVFIRT